MGEVEVILSCAYYHPSFPNAPLTLVQNTSLSLLFVSRILAIFCDKYQSSIMLASGTMLLFSFFQNGYKVYSTYLSSDENKMRPFI